MKIKICGCVLLIKIHGLSHKNSSTFLHGSSPFTESITEPDPLSQIDTAPRRKIEPRGSYYCHCSELLMSGLSSSEIPSTTASRKWRGNSLGNAPQHSGDQCQSFCGFVSWRFQSQSWQSSPVPLGAFFRGKFA